MSRAAQPMIDALEARTLLAAQLIITKGGTYSGTFESTIAGKPAIIIRTAAPVII